ncbi:hypothetical protein TIFTF001_045082, partial [Ficus carica]
MIKYGVSPNIATFNSILDAQCKEGRTVEALYLAEAVIEKGPALGGRARATHRDVKFGLTPKLLSGPTPGSSEKWDLQEVTCERARERKFDHANNEDKELYLLSFRSLFEVYAV